MHKTETGPMTFEDFDAHFVQGFLNDFYPYQDPDIKVNAVYNDGGVRSTQEGDLSVLRQLDRIESATIYFDGAGERRGQIQIQQHPNGVGFTVREQTPDKPLQSAQITPACYSPEL